MQHCPRCLNLGLVPDVLNAGREGDGPATPAIRCVICGFFADKLIMARWLSYKEQATTPSDATTWDTCIKGAAR